jgi:two-component system NtrC family sensor kinase
VQECDLFLAERPRLLSEDADHAEQCGVLAQSHIEQAAVAAPVQRTAELSDALEQQTAAAEVLGVINSSPGDLAPVFDSMLDKALRLCGADFSNLLRYDGKLFHVASAVHGNREIGERNRGRAPFPPPPGGLLHPILQGEDVVYVEDLLHDPAYHSVAEIREMVVLRQGNRTGPESVGILSFWGNHRGARSKSLK